MVQRRDGERFFFQTRDLFERLGQLGMEKLERDGAIEPQIERLVDHAHAALSQLVPDFVMRDDLPEHPCISDAKRSIIALQVW